MKPLFHYLVFIVLLIGVSIFAFHEKVNAAYETDEDDISERIKLIIAEEERIKCDCEPDSGECNCHLQPPCDCVEGKCNCTPRIERKLQETTPQSVGDLVKKSYEEQMALLSDYDKNANVLLDENDDNIEDIEFEDLYSPHPIFDTRRRNAGDNLGLKIGLSIGLGGLALCGMSGMYFYYKRRQMKPIEIEGEFT